jgi:hypothetical protein
MNDRKKIFLPGLSQRICTAVYIYRKKILPDQMARWFDSVPPDVKRISSAFRWLGTILFSN